MSKLNILLTLGAIVPVFLASCDAVDRDQQVQPIADIAPRQFTATKSPVAEDVLFVVLGKMALYDQGTTGELALRNHHFVAEIMPKAGRKIIGGTLSDAKDASKNISFNPEGIAFMAHGARVSDPNELHRLHPDGAYVFSYRTESGRMDSQVLDLKKREYIDGMPAPAKVSAKQNGLPVTDSMLDANTDLELSWEKMPGNMKAPDSELADLIFVLAFDCFGNNIAHSGRPYQGGSFLTYENTRYVIPAAALMPGLNYTVVVEQATADVTTTLGVPGIATYATLTFLKFASSGTAQADSCPAVR